MREIFRGYGKTILAVCVAMFLFLLAITMLNLAAQRQESIGEGNFRQYQDALFTRQLYTREPPAITWLGGSTLSVGTAVELDSYFRAEDTEGVEIPVTILSICDSMGRECENPFALPGIYRIKVTATDRLGKTATVFVDVPIG